MNPKAKILAVDDDIALLKLTEALLNERYEVSLAKSGQQALSYLSRMGCPDLILLDIDMPDMDGFETLLKLRESENGRSVPVIYLSGLSSPGCEAKALKAGAVDFISKPIQKDVLTARIELRLSQTKAQKKLELLLENKNKLGGLDPEKLSYMESLLSKTEFAVASLAAQGYTNEEIGGTLSYSPAYVKKVVSRVFDKLDISKRGELKGFFI